MGRDKALLPWNDTTLLEHSVSKLRSLVSDILIVADIPEKYNFQDCRVIADILPGIGPVGGILTGLTVLGEGSYIVIPCDMPFILPELLAYMLELASPEYDAVVPFPNGRAEPLCAVYNYSSLPLLLQFVDTGGRAAHKALKHLHVHRIESAELLRIDPSLKSFANLNTPQDLKADMYDEAQE